MACRLGQPGDGATIVVRHGATDWTASGRHTGRHEIPLSEAGREQARALASLLPDCEFATVLASPQGRARETCELSGFGADAEVVDDLVEWDYGEFDGLTDKQTAERWPGWSLFKDGGPGGESPADVEARLARVLERLRTAPGPRIVFSHGKTLRALAALWLRQPIGMGEELACDPAAVGTLDVNAGRPLLRLWNLQPFVAASRP